jgi:hypothetical protein
MADSSLPRADDTAEWKALEAHASELRSTGTTISSLFDGDAKRFDKHNLAMPTGSDVEGCVVDINFFFNSFFLHRIENESFFLSQPVTHKKKLKIRTLHPGILPAPVNRAITQFDAV